MMKVGVLASGSGSNFQALVDSLHANGGSAAKISAVICNVPGARVLTRAEAAGVPGVLIDHKPFGKDRAAWDEAAVKALQQHGVELVCLAGYMRLVTPTLLRAFPGRVINVHPALLPSFPGLNGIKQALDASVRVTGCTLHFVDEGMDTGPIIAQRAVPVLQGDDEATLGARIHAEEHRLYPAVVRAFAEGRITLEGRKVTVEGSL